MRESRVREGRGKEGREGEGGVGCGARRLAGGRCPALAKDWPGHDLDLKLVRELHVTQATSHQYLAF